MKDGKKRLRTRDGFPESRKKEERIGLAAVVIILAAIVLIPSIFVHLMPSSPQETDFTSGEPRAVIVDQLSLTSPNQTFSATTTNILKQAGYAVDYYPGENVTVDFFRTLASRKYKLVILRVHSTAVVFAEGTFWNAPVTIFTSEEYNTNQYVLEQMTGQIVSAMYPVPESLSYFAITPQFIISSMRGLFNNTAIIMMGCDGLNNTHMAEAFVERGASVYIGWNKSPQAIDTDSATSRLLQRLMVQKETLNAAVQSAMEEVRHGFEDQQLLLLYHPQNVGEEKIEDILNR